MKVENIYRFNWKKLTCRFKRWVKKVRCSMDL